MGNPFKGKKGFCNRKNITKKQIFWHVLARTRKKGAPVTGASKHCYRAICFFADLQRLSKCFSATFLGGCLLTKHFSSWRKREIDFVQMFHTWKKLICYETDTILGKSGNYRFDSFGFSEYTLGQRHKIARRGDKKGCRGKPTARACMYFINMFRIVKICCCYRLFDHLTTAKIAISHFSK